MPDKEIFVLKIVWKKSIASLHRLTQVMQLANLRRTAGDPTWVFAVFSIWIKATQNSYKKCKEFLDSKLPNHKISFSIS